MQRSNCIIAARQACYLCWVFLNLGGQKSFKIKFDFRQLSTLAVNVSETKQAVKKWTKRFVKFGSLAKKVLLSHFNLP